MPRQIRSEYVGQALEGARPLQTVLNYLTEEEILEALRLESQIGNRETIIRRLINRYVTLKATSIREQLNKEYL